MRAGGADGRRPSGVIQRDALRNYLAVAIRVGHRDGITLSKVTYGLNPTGPVDARTGVEGECPVTLPVPTLDRSASRAVSVVGLTSRC